MMAGRRTYYGYNLLLYGVRERDEFQVEREVELSRAHNVSHWVPRRPEQSSTVIGTDRAGEERDRDGLLGARHGEGMWC